jgi:uracil-DNA glycosylase family protein
MDSSPAPTLDVLRRRAAGCTACSLYKRATQTVFGEGPTGASLMIVGEQPGNEEDLAGRPFVGPAGRLLDRALAKAGLDRGQVYITNAVKHFKWRPAGKVRLHKKPNAEEIRACRPWWEAELAALQPELLCCLGATAAQAVFGTKFRVTRQRGEIITLPSGMNATATVHPSAILRADDDRRDSEYADFVDDLRHVAEQLGPS